MARFFVQTQPNHIKVIETKPKYEQMGFTSYTDYLTHPLSPWHNTVKRYKKMFPVSSTYCWICDGESMLNTHHEEYARLGKEDVRQDLKTLCRNCHQIVHREDNGEKTKLFREHLVKRRRQLRVRYVLQNLRPRTLKYFIKSFIYRLQP